MRFVKKYIFKFEVVVFLLFLGLSMVISCSSGINPKNKIGSEAINGEPEITFDTLFYDFGDLTQGEKASVTFKFKNTGTADLLILDAYSTCGCTIPEYSNQPVASGEEGKVEVVFDSANRSGLQNKTITLKINNHQGEKSLWIKANVVSNK
ncbi:MAG: DUF1573 domain-containing protein [Bacteroidales bacterium]